MSLTPKLFHKQELPREVGFSPIEPGVSIVSQPFLLEKDVYFWEESDGSTLCYALQSPSLTLSKQTPDKESKKCETLNLSLFHQNREKLSVKQIKIFGDILTLHIDYFTTAVRIPTYGGFVWEDGVPGSTIIFINKRSLSLIGNVDNISTKILDYELAENGHLRVFKQEDVNSSITYDLLHEKSGCCTIL